MLIKPTSIKTFSVQTFGLSGKIIDVEIDLSPGLHRFSIVGLADKAVDESKDRISAAVKNSGFETPQKRNKRIIISLAPANLKKEGPVFDLAIAMAFLLATEQINFNSSGKIFLGELSLDGTLRPIKGALSLVKTAKENGFKEVYLPVQNAKEAALIEGIDIYGIRTISELVPHIEGGEKIKKQEKTLIKTNEDANCSFDFSDIKGQETAKRGLEIAAAGGHNILMSGPPGTGKTMLAKAFASILPPLSTGETLESTAIHSIAGILDEPYMTNRPLRSPHHTSSYVALVGGGAWPKPGEITLSHRGVLFLDELPLFEKRVLEALRQPLEDGIVTVSRARGSIKFPARFILVCAMNPCPCGNYGSDKKQCTCSMAEISRYQTKISGPIMDRIDLHLEVPQIEIEKLSDKNLKSPTSSEIRKNITKARKIQKERFSNKTNTAFNLITTNSEMSARDIENLAPLDNETRKILNTSANDLNLSARAYHRVIKLARTIADLDDSENIQEEHIYEALQYRPKSNQ